MTRNPVSILSCNHSKARLCRSAQPESVMRIGAISPTTPRRSWSRATLPIATMGITVTGRTGRAFHYNCSQPPGMTDGLGRRRQRRGRLRLPGYCSRAEQTVVDRAHPAARKLRTASSAHLRARLHGSG